MPTRRLFLTAIAAAAVSGCSSPPAFAAGSLVDVQIVDRSRGETLPSWQYRGASYVAGRPGDRYAVRLTNRSPGRVLVVLSVDGVNAVSGETAAVAQTGYVLAPYQSAEITGWRKSFSEAAAFYFTALPDSYAARTHRPDNVGVIGAAVFRERVPEPVGPRVGARAIGRQGSERRRPSRGRAPELRARAPMPRRRRRSRRHVPDPTRSLRATRRSSAPATASASIRRPARPRSSGRVRRRPRSSRCATTATPISWRAASSRGSGRGRASRTRSRRSSPIRVESC